MKLLKALTLSAIIGLSLPVYAMNCSFSIRIDNDDLYSSKGVKLATIGQIIRQDRANFHAGVPSGDSPDYCGFENAKKRETLQRIIDKSKISQTTKNRIKRGEVDIAIDIVNNRAYIEINE